MGIHDRDYVNTSRGMGSSYNDGGGRSSIFFSHPRLWSVTTWIIMVNVLIHFVVVPLVPKVYLLSYLSVEMAFQRLEVWRLVSFQFLHDPRGITHIAFNMLGLIFFAPMVEKYLGKKKFFAFYLMCGLSGGLLFVILNMLGAFTPLQLLNDGFKTPLIGASAGVFGVILAGAYLSPDSEVQILFLPIFVKMKTFAYGYVALALFMLLRGSDNAGGEAAHIGGAIAGFYFIRNHRFLIDFFDIFGDSREPKKSKTKSGKKRSTYRNYKNTPGPSQDDIDKILKKVSQKGLASLSEKEKKTLAEASKNEP
jgi:membrane associated rhomboid family serine protease